MKNRLFLLCSMLSLAGALCSCENERPAPDPSLSAAPESLTFVAAGETKTLAVTSEAVEWRATCEADWIVLADAQGSASGTVSVTALPNGSTQTLTATVVLRAEGLPEVNVPVTQAAAEASLRVAPLTLAFAAVGETKSLAVEANVAWKAATDARWLELGTAEGTGNGTVSVTTTANAPRELSAVITLSAEGVDDVTVEVTQQAGAIRVADLYGVYRAQYDKWDLDARSAFYPIVNGEYDYDNAITVRQYCEQYAADYNAANNPATPVTAEDCSYNWFDAGRHVRFEITADKFQMVRFVEITEGHGINIYEIDGSYTYDDTTGEFLIHDLSVADDPRDITVTVTRCKTGEIDLRIADYYWWGALSYDGKTEYLPFVTTTYVTETMQ